MEHPDGWCPFDVGDRSTYPHLCAPTQVLYDNGQTRIGDFLHLVSRTRVEKISPIVRWRYIGKVVNLEHMPGISTPSSTLPARSKALEEATLSGTESDGDSTEAERRDTFGRLSHHRDNCRECRITSQGEVDAVLRKISI